MFTLLGAGATPAWIVFGLFVAARWLHTVAYLRGLQPWRTVFFLVGAAIIAGLMVAVVVMLARG